jgi:DNA polymerase
MTVDQLRRKARRCQACPLYKNATQTVFGEGAEKAQLMLVGEQPGDSEDRDGHPFTGPAGKLLDKILGELEIPRAQVYVTNAVKHFKWTRSGKRRLHQKPNAQEIAACHHWLEAELKVIQPRVIICLGATAARSVLGRPMSIASARGKILKVNDRQVLLTYHPSAILRAKDNRDELRRQLKADLKRAWKLCTGTP